MRTNGNSKDCGFSKEEVEEGEMGEQRRAGLVPPTQPGINIFRTRGIR